MKKETKTWMLVTDGARARAFQLDARPRDWQLLRTFEHPASRAHEHDLVTDRPGRSLTPTRGTYGAGLVHGSPHANEIERFARELAGFLDAAATEGSYDRLVLIAPPRLLGLLRDHVGAPVRNRIAMELARDYAELPPLAIDRRVKDARRRAAARA